VRVRRSLLSLVVVFVFLVPAAPAFAQHQGHNISDMDSTVRIVDAEKDVILAAGTKATGQNQNTSSLPTSFDHIDILGVVFGDETDKDFRVQLKMKSLTNSNPAGFAFKYIDFTYGKIKWRLVVAPCNQRLDPTASVACLTYGDSGRGNRPVKEFKMEKQDQTLIFPIQKEWLFNENRVPPRFGSQLANISVWALHYYAGIPWNPLGGGDPTGGFYAYDTAPNAGPSPLPFRLNKGSNAHGHLALDSADPIRVSNGEATTIVYKLNLLNHNTEPFKVSLDTRGVPADWSVRVPALVEVPGASTIVLPVIASVPFTHFHGKTFTFQVHAQALEDQGSYAEETIGVYWTEIPQPSAHHETEDGGTFFHSARVANDRVLDQLEEYVPTFQMWMNGIATDPDPSVKDENVPSVFNEYVGCFFHSNVGCGAPPESTATWFFPLSPSLLIGLDFDLTRDGLAHFDMVPKVASPSAHVAVRLLYCDPDALIGSKICLGNQTQNGDGMGTCPTSYAQVLASGDRSVVLSANTPATADVPLKLDSKYDLVPYKQGTNVGLCIQLKSQVPQNAVFVSDPRASPEFVVKGARLRLPLIEYHDPIDQAFVNVGALNLEAKDPYEKMINPGKAAVFHYSLKTNSSDPMPVRVEVQGINHQWASIAGADQFVLKPGEVHNVLLLVRAPDDAQQDERAELFLVATSVRDASIVTVSRLRGHVVTAPDIPDESAEVLALQHTKKSPGPEFTLLLTGLAAVAFAVRRRK
jgi:hypothetical protein